MIDLAVVKINPKKLEGTINIPSSKSICHRAVISASLAKGTSYIEDVNLSEDIKATCEGMKSLGVDIKYICGNKLKIERNEEFRVINKIINCRESGSTLRFLIPIFLLFNDEVTFIGEGKLVERPLDVYYEIFDRKNITYRTNDRKLPLTVKGVLSPGVFQMRGDISSQFITGMMFALPLLSRDSTIKVEGYLQSKGYVDLTIDVLNEFGIIIVNNDYREFYIKGEQHYEPLNYNIEGDFSQGAFWIVAGILGGNIECTNLDMNSKQGDKIIVDLIRSMGGDIQVYDDKIRTIYSNTNGRIIDVSQCPDLVPILAVLGALSKGTTKIVNAERARIKESDRLRAISTELKKLGGDVEERDDGLIIEGKKELKGGKVDSWNDHRIAMALAVASIGCKEPIVINGSEVVNKSYPKFWDDFRKLGGAIDGWSVWQ